MINVRTTSGSDIALDDIFTNSDSISYNLLYGNTDATVSIMADIVTYLKARGGGRVTINENITKKIHRLVVDMHKDKNGNYKTTYLYSNYRNPIGTETRPYSGELWQAGDIIYNIDVDGSDDKCLLWYCKKSATIGNAGEWSPLTAWKVSVEELETIVKNHVDSNLSQLVLEDLQANGATYVSDEVTRQINNILPAKVTAEVTSQVQTKVEDITEDIVTNKLPSVVKERVDTLAPTIINAKLDVVLEESKVKKIIHDRVDPQITQIISESKTKIDTKLNEATTKLDKDVSDYIAEARIKLANLTVITETDVDNKIQASETKLTKLIDDKINEKLPEMQTGHKEFISTDEFKLAGDGVADDTAKFKQAVNAAEGKILLVGKGTFKLSELVIVDKCKDVIILGGFTGILPIIKGKAQNGENTKDVVEKLVGGVRYHNASSDSIGNKKLLATWGIESGTGYTMCYLLYKEDGKTYHVYKEGESLSGDGHQIGELSGTDYEDLNNIKACPIDNDVIIGIKNSRYVIDMNTYSVTSFSDSKYKKITSASGLIKDYGTGRIIAVGSSQIQVYNESLEIEYILNYSSIPNTNIPSPLNYIDKRSVCAYNGIFILRVDAFIYAIDLFHNTYEIMNVPSIQNSIYVTSEGLNISYYMDGYIYTFNKKDNSNFLLKQNFASGINNSLVSDAIVAYNGTKLISSVISGWIELGNKDSHFRVNTGDERISVNNNNKSNELAYVNDLQSYYTKGQTDTKVNEEKNRINKVITIATSVESVPDTVNKLAVVPNGTDFELYISKGTASKEDWVKIYSSKTGAIEKVVFANGAELWVT